MRRARAVGLCLALACAARADARSVFSLAPGFAQQSALPAACRTPGALAFLTDARVAALGVRWTLGSVSALDVAPSTPPLNLSATRASWITPADATLAFALGPRAGIAVTARRTDDTVDASRVTLASIASPDSADGTQSAVGSSTCDTYSVSCGVRTAEWMGVGVTVGTQVSRAHVRVARRETLEDPPGAPPTALSRLDETHDVLVMSRPTPLVAWGLALRPLPFVDLDVALRPSVAIRYETVVSRLSGLSEVYYPSSQIFSANRYSVIVSPAEARGRSTREVSVAARLRPHPRAACGAGVTQATIYPVVLEPRGGSVEQDRLVVEEPRRHDLWHAELEVRATRTVACALRWEQMLRAGWDVDGRPAEEHRLAGLGVAVSLDAARTRVRLACARFAGSGGTAVPLPPSSAAATQRLADTRLTAMVEWR